MDNAAAVTKPHEGVEAVYRAEGERLWRAIYAFAGDAEIASDAVADAFAQVLNRGAAVRDPAACTWRTALRRRAPEPPKMAAVMMVIPARSDLIEDRPWGETAGIETRRGAAGRRES